jgi:hypothetical protein
MKVIIPCANDVLGRKCLRAELNADHDQILIDLPKKFSGARDRYTEHAVVRYLEKEDALFLGKWLMEAAAEMPD